MVPSIQKIFGPLVLFCMSKLQSKNFTFGPELVDSAQDELSSDRRITRIQELTQMWQGKHFYCIQLLARGAAKGPLSIYGRYGTGSPSKGGAIKALAPSIEWVKIVVVPYRI